MPYRFPCFLFCLLMSLASCYKTNATSLTVQVNNGSGTALAGATVKVKGVPPENTEGTPLLIDFTEATNGNGIAFFNMNGIYNPGQSGVAIVEVLIQKDGLSAEGTINLLEETNNKIDFVLQ